MAGSPLQADARVLANLLDGVHGRAHGGERSWLAPFTDGENEVHMLYDAPVRLGGITFFNYSKTPTRGANRFQLYLDGNLVLAGELESAATARGSGAQHVLFTSQSRLRLSEIENTIACTARDPTVTCVEDGVNRVSFS